MSLGSLVLVPLVLARVSQLARLHAQAEHELVHQATHDALTALPNRRAVDTHLQHVLAELHDGRVAGALVCFLDLDGFKVVNDEHGHKVGDRLLVAVAARLRTAVRAEDFVARFGGDEFVLVLTGDPDRLAAETVGRIRGALSAPVDLGPTTAAARASIGTYAVGPRDRVTAEQVLSAADARMYEDKRDRARQTVTDL